MDMCMCGSDKNVSVVQFIVLFMVDSVEKKVNIYVYVCGGSTWPIILLDQNYYSR